MNRVVMLFRHLLSIAILPFTVAVLVPVWIARRNDVVPALGRSIGEIALQLIGVAVFVVGFLLFAASLRRFVTEGEGTLAPWDRRAGSWCAARIASCATR